MSAPAEERKLASLLFADLVGSTQLAGSQDPERTRALLTRFYDAMETEIAATGGTVEKFAGDAVMAAFGAPAAHEDHAERALHAALSMRSRLQELFGDLLRIRIGVNTGEVVVGAARHGSSFVTGDPVNVAARLEQAAQPGEILVGERTAALAGGAFSFAEPRRVEAKGKPGGVLARRLVRHVHEGGTGRRPRAFVGRERQVAELWTLFEQAIAEGAPRLVTVVGEAGVGKTTVVQALRARLTDHGVESYAGRCSAYGRAIAYRPIADILRARLGIHHLEDPEAVRARLQGREILGLALGLEPPRELDPREARAQLERAWVDFLEALVADGPVAVVVDDLQWAQDALLELLDAAVGEVRGPLLIIGGARPEPVARLPHGTQLRLEPLAAADVGRMLDELAGDLPPEARERVLERAEGNPLFVEEIVQSFADHGYTVELPDRVQGVIAARIDLLPAPDRAALQAGAVVGRAFWEGAVRALVPAAPDDLGLLEARDLVRSSPRSSLQGEREYLFKHALTGEVAYTSLAAARRVRLHATCAEWLERVGGARDDQAPRLAHHFSQAAAAEWADLAWPGEEDRLEAVRRKAVIWLRRAGELAFGRCELQDAAALFAQAAGLEREPAARVELLRASARAAVVRFDTDWFRSAMEQALDVAGDGPASGELYAELAVEGSAPWMWRSPPAASDVERWAALALERAEPGSAAHARALMAHARLHPETGGDAAHEGLRLAQRTGDPHLILKGWFSRAHVAEAAGDVAERCRCGEQCLALIPQIADPAVRSDALTYAIFCLAAAGRMADAARLTVELDALAAGLSAHHEVHASSWRLMMETLHGRWQSAGRLAARAEAAVARNADTPCQFNWRSMLLGAHAYAELGDDRESHRLQARAERTAPDGTALAQEPALLRLALARRDRTLTEQALDADPGPAKAWDIDYRAARLDALAWLADRAAVEDEAARALALGGYVEPFALRALGVVRRDGALVARAAERFAALGLEWRAG